jgi:hypothetical protein
VSVTFLEAYARSLWWGATAVVVDLGEPASDTYR